MPHVLRHRSLAALGLLAAAGACTPSSAEQAGSGSRIIPAGKADNYYSSAASEYEVKGTVRVAMTEDEYADEALRAARVNERLTAIGLYLTAYVTDKFEGIDKNNDGVISEDEIFFRNVGYGGFFAMVRNYAFETLEVVPSDGGYQVSFTLDLAGPKNLMREIPRAEGATGGFAFDLRMPKDEAVDPESVPRGEFRNFNPDTYTGELETHRLEMKTLPDPGNAYPDFAAFMADGVFDITLFYGYDYNTPRSDLREAEEAFDALVNLGFDAPVAFLEALRADSGPFTKRIRAGGRDVTVEVRIFYEPMYVGDRQAQHDAALAEIGSRDVFFYNGHAGPYYGFYLDEAKAASVGYLEFRDAPFRDEAQLVIAQGCQTYSQYADMLYANPAKSEDNLDVITTVNYSYGIGTLELLENLIRTDDADAHVPTDFYRIVSDLNAEYWNRQKQVFYGVTGLDGNPQLHPYARLDRIGDRCSDDGDCGGIGNACAGEGSERACAARALAQAACPAGTSFGFLGADELLTDGVCYRAQ